MNALLDMILNGLITQDEYAQKKRSCLEEKKENEMKLAAFGRLDGHRPCGRHWHSLEREGSKRFEPLMGFYKTAVLAGESSVAGNPEENLQILKKIGSNFLLGGKKMKVNFNFPAAETQKLHALPGFGSADFGNSVNWRPLRDSNP